MRFSHASRIGSLSRVFLAGTAIVVFASGCAHLADSSAIALLGEDRGTPAPAAAAAAAAASDEGAETPAIEDATRIDWGPFSDLSRLELAFQGVDPGDLVYVNGPYELVYWDEQRVELVGEAFPQLEPAHLTLLQKGAQLWAHLRVVDAEYLTRVE